jgi:GNAT superfamily N-acetyltransferase
MTFEWRSVTDADFSALTKELDVYFRLMLGERQNTFDPCNTAASLHSALVASENGQAVACAALKLYSDGSAELKRVYITPAYRGKGLGRQIVTLAEERAIALGCRKIILETNPAFSAAVSLYTSLGYQKTDNFGCYCGVDTLCMAKTLPALSVNGD